MPCCHSKACKVQAGFRLCYTSARQARLASSCRPCKAIRFEKPISIGRRKGTQGPDNEAAPPFPPPIQPTGLSTRNVLQVISSIPGQVVGADVVEYNPDNDFKGLTAVVAAKLVKELLCRMTLDAQGGGPGMQRGVAAAG